MQTRSQINYKCGRFILFTTDFYSEPTFIHNWLLFTTDFYSEPFYFIHNRLLFRTEFYSEPFYFIHNRLLFTTDFYSQLTFIHNRLLFTTDFYSKPTFIHNRFILFTTDPHDRSGDAATDAVGPQDGLQPGGTGENGEIVGGPRTPQQMMAQKRMQQTQAQVDAVSDLGLKINFVLTNHFQNWIWSFSLFIFGSKNQFKNLIRFFGLEKIYPFSFQQSSFKTRFGF